MKFVEVEVVPIQSEQIILAACTDRVKPIAYGPKDKYTSIGQNVTFTSLYFMHMMDLSNKSIDYGPDLELVIVRQFPFLYLTVYNAWY
jgi:hypothetical protein